MIVVSIMQYWSTHFNVLHGATFAVPPAWSAQVPLLRASDLSRSRYNLKLKLEIFILIVDSSSSPKYRLLWP